MARRPTSPLRIGVALAGALLVTSVVVGSADTLGGITPETIGAATGDIRSISSARLEWNPDAGDLSLYPHTLRLTAGVGETFRRDDTVDITAVGPGSDTCAAKATVVREGARAVDVAFTACGVPLWELNGVAVTVSGQGGGTTLKTNVGELAGTMAAFNGDVVRPARGVSASHTTSRIAGTESVVTLRLAVGDASVDQLVGKRFMAMVSTMQNQTTPWTGTIGTKSSNTGIWVESDPQSAITTVVADLRVLTGGRAPQVADVEQYRLVALQPQQLGAEQTTADQYAVSTARGAVAGTGRGPVADVTTALEPVGLDDRLKFSVIQRDEQTIPSLSFCYTFRVTNTSSAAVDWQVAFDTNKQPFWGMNPIAARSPNGVGMQSLWGGETSSFDVATGLWTIKGEPHNKTIPAATRNDHRFVDVGYCVQPPVPPMNRDAFTAPAFSVEPGSDRYKVALRVKLGSSSQFLVPWEAEIDFARYVCASTLPKRIVGERATLTRIEGTRYRVQGKDADTRFVSANRSQDFIFARYNPNGNPFELGTCS